MEEKEEKFSIDTENLKNETVETAKKIKESVKGTNIKEETKVTKNFVLEMFKNPLEKIEEVAQDSTGKYFKTAIFLVIIWTLAVFIDAGNSYFEFLGFSRLFENILSVLKLILAPAVGTIVYALIVQVLNKEKRKSLIAVISTITITKLPIILSEVLSLLTLISYNITTITTPFAKICSAVSIVLGYFGLKNLFEEDSDKTFIKKYVLIQIIYYIAYVVVKLFGIYI